jgi:hypothetical protein
MNLHSACRAILSGATLLAIMTIATPDNARAQSATSPCLDHRPAPASDEQKAAQKQRHQWRSPCYLADAEKKEDEHEDAVDTAHQDIQQRLDDIDLLGRRGPASNEESAPLWPAPGSYGHGDTGLAPTASAPVSAAHHPLPLYAASAPHGTLPLDEARAGAAIPAVPEPANAILLATGLAVLAGVARRRRRH